MTLGPSIMMVPSGSMITTARSTFSSPSLTILMVPSSRAITRTWSDLATTTGPSETLTGSAPPLSFGRGFPKFASTSVSIAPYRRAASFSKSGSPSALGSPDSCLSVSSSLLAFVTSFAAVGLSVPRPATMSNMPAACLLSVSGNPSSALLPRWSGAPVLSIPRTMIELFEPSATQSAGRLLNLGTGSSTIASPASASAAILS